MNQNFSLEQLDKGITPAKRTASVLEFGLCVSGVILLLSAVLFFGVTAFNAFSSDEGTKTMVSVLACLALYQAGKILLHQVNKVKLHPERRLQADRRRSDDA
ncbi:hypothetical protein [Alteromonas gilva]|uniref:Uncharacterized protein n=1 Tax=Alteromonas gilva TaxID=2987522 RepID=A0ABT5KXF1_9ALTE|nr:hypothetical protein [Alteromonas gilva]MDC8829318.1 hypothetical protein [Alteromonas gilva]